MFTRCPECRTVFHVSAAELRAAAGSVICGACGATFDALETLSETRPAEQPAEHAADEETAGEEPEHPAPDEGEPLRDEDAFLEELEALIGTEEEEEDWLPEESPAAEGPAMTPEETPEEVPETSFAEAADLPPEAERRYGDEELPEEAFPDPDAVFRVDDFTDDSDSGDEPFVGDDESPEDEESAWISDPRGTPDEAGPGHAHTASIGTEDDEATGDGAELEDGEKFPEFAREQSGNGRGRRLWLPVLVALLVILLLTGTWAHSQRGKLMRHPAGEALLGPVYSVLGMKVTPEWNPAAFRALKWEAVADPDRPTRLIVAVEFVNDAAYAQPYPMIRVALQDRFGRPAGRHDFAPADYLDSHSRGRRLPAGGRVQTTVDVPDPQGRAEGFRIDFCLQTEARGLVCGPELFR